MTPALITEALTAAEARRVVLDFLTALDEFDMRPDVHALVHGLQSAADLAERLASGIPCVPSDPRAKLSDADKQLIASSDVSSYALARRFQVAPSTVRAARCAMRRAA